MIYKMDVCDFSAAVKILLLLFASEVRGIGPPKADIVDLDVLCDKSGMNVHVTFDRPFQGIVFSKGYFNNPLCRYVAPNSALSSFTFVIPAEGCGTILEETSGRVILDSTLIFQQDPLFQAGWDNVRTLSCDWQAYQGKTVTSSPVGVSAKRPQRAHISREVIDARLEIRAGADAFAEGSPRETVHVGDRMTAVVLVSDGGRNYDIRVKNCYAYDEPIVSSNSTLKILLLDEEGCPLKPHLLSAFQITKDTKDTGANIAAYASMFAFRFPHKDQLFLSCGVEVCRSKCPNSCSALHGTRLPNYPTRESRYMKRTGGFPQSTEVYSAQSEHISSNKDLNLSSTRRLMKATMNIMASGIRNASKIELVAQHSNVVDKDSNSYGKTDLVTPIALEFEDREDSVQRLISIAKDQNLPIPLIRDQINEATHLQKSVDNFVATVQFDETLPEDDKGSEKSNQSRNSIAKSSETTNSLFGDKETNSSAEEKSGGDFGNITAGASHELGILSFDVVDMEPDISDITRVCVPKFRFYFILGLIVLFIVCLLLTILSLSLCLRRARRKLFAERYLLYRYN